MQLAGTSGRSPEMSVHVGVPERPLVVLKTCPGRVGVLLLNPENVAYAVFPVASEASASISETKRFGRIDGSSTTLQVAMHGPGGAQAGSTVVDTSMRPSDAPV